MQSLTRGVVLLEWCGKHRSSQSLNSSAAVGMLNNYEGRLSYRTASAHRQQADDVASILWGCSITKMTFIVVEHCKKTIYFTKYILKINITLSILRNESFQKIQYFSIAIFAKKLILRGEKYNDLSLKKKVAEQFRITTETIEDGKIYHPQKPRYHF